MTNLATKLIDEQMIKAYDKGYATATVKCERRMETALKEQVERAEDHFASEFAYFIAKLKKIQVLADAEQALDTDIALQKLIIEATNKKKGKNNE